MGLPQATPTDLTLVGIGLTPQFDPALSSYSASIRSEVPVVFTVTATPLLGGFMSITPADADSTSTDHQVALNEGTNEITITATKPGAVSWTYTMVVDWIVIPAKTTNLSATGSDNEVGLTWDAPAGGADITHYEYRYKASSDATYTGAWTAIIDSAPGEVNEGSLTIVGLANGTRYHLEVRTVNSGGPSDASNEASALAGLGLGICSRTSAVHQEIVAAIAGVNDFADVTANHLETFAGALRFDNLLTELEARDFHGLASLTEMLITFNPQLTELPCDVFSDLMSLEKIHLHDDGLEYLLWQAFLGLSSLGTLRLDNNQIYEMESDVFENLTVLTSLRLNNNSLTQVSGGIFDNLSSLEELSLEGNEVG